MGSGKKFAPVRTTDPTLTEIQKNVGDVFDQLEDERRGLVTSDVFTKAGATQLSEVLVARYIGPGTETWTLPRAALRGSSKAQVIIIIHAGKGSLTVSAAGDETVMGAKSISMTLGGAMLLTSDGISAWYQV